MTALKGKAIDAFVKARDRAVRVILIYGPDDGLVRERARTLGLSVVRDLNDPFNAIELTEGDLKADPARLVDEAAAISFTGDERLIRVRANADAVAPAVTLLVDGIDSGHLKPASVAIIEAGDLGKTSKLRKLVEASKTARALPCYADSPLDVRALAKERAHAAGLTIEPEALDLLVASLGDDRGVSRAEIEKLILYAGPEGAPDRSGLIDVVTVRASIVDSIADATYGVAAAAADQNLPALSAGLYQCDIAGASPIALLRAGMREFDRLRQARASIAAGASASDAMSRLRPPVFFKEQRAFETRLRRWSPVAIDLALERLLEAERAAKSTGAPHTELMERAFFSIASLPLR